MPDSLPPRWEKLLKTVADPKQCRKLLSIAALEVIRGNMDTATGNTLKGMLDSILRSFEADGSRLPASSPPVQCCPKSKRACSFFRVADAKP